MAILFVYNWAKNMDVDWMVRRQLGMNRSTTVNSDNYMREVCAWKL
jgi:hypothetical protein